MDFLSFCAFGVSCMLYPFAAYILALGICGYRGEHHKPIGVQQGIEVQQDDWVRHGEVVVARVLRYEESKEPKVNAELSDIMEDCPEHLRCPITWNLFRDPVRTKYGNVYERRALEAWLQSRMDANCPLTRRPLSLADVGAAPDVVAEVAKWCEQRRAQVLRSQRTLNRKQGRKHLRKHGRVPACARMGKRSTGKTYC